MDALNDILRSFRGEYNKTPVQIQVCSSDVVAGLVIVLYVVLTSFTTVGARLLFSVRGLHWAGAGKCQLIWRFYTASVFAATQSDNNTVHIQPVTAVTS